MSMDTPGRRSRSRRSERAEQLYAARDLPAEACDEARYASGADGGYDDRPPVYTPNEEADAAGEESALPPLDTPNGEEPPRSFPAKPIASAAKPFASFDQAQDEPSVSLPRHEELAANLAAYYRRPAMGDVSAPRDDGDAGDGYVYAPPFSISAGGEDKADSENDGGEPASPRNVYRPRQVSWAETARREAENAGYRVEEEESERQPALRRRKRRRARRVVALACALALLGAGAFWFREPLEQLYRDLTGQTAKTAAPSAAITTAAPVRAYDAATPVKITGKTSRAISQISGTLELEPYVVTDSLILTRNARADGAFDFYLFGASDGRLLAYFEGLSADGMAPLPDGGFFLRQEPYLIGEDGSAMIKTQEIERTLGQAASLQPMMNGWAVIQSADGKLLNYIDREGRLLSRLWFARAFPMSGSKSVAYVDTGNLSDTKGRYALYIVSAEGEAEKWREAGDMTDVVACACGAVYLASGELYLLSEPSAPLLTTNDVTVYMDCDAMVVRDAASGKYGLFVHGERHYDFVYDSIQPIPSDVTWAERVLEGAGGAATLRYVTGAAYPQPLSHSFMLEKDGVREYVALSTASPCPVPAP